MSHRRDASPGAPCLTCWHRWDEHEYECGHCKVVNCQCVHYYIPPPGQPAVARSEVTVIGGVVVPPTAQTAELLVRALLPKRPSVVEIMGASAGRVLNTFLAAWLFTMWGWTPLWILAGLEAAVLCVHIGIRFGRTRA